jgi:hypothetical protein
MKSHKLFHVNIWLLKSLQATYVAYFSTFLQNFLQIFFMLFVNNIGIL